MDELEQEEREFKGEATGLNISETFSKTEHFIEQNQKNIGIGVGVIALLIMAYFGYQKLIVAPEEKDAEAQMFVAVRYFEQDSLKKAVNGDAAFPGFEGIIDQYGATPAANTAHYYLGICYLKMGQYQKAIDVLKDYKAKDDITGPLAIGGIGDANMELGIGDEAATYYLKAAEMAKNKFTSPIFLMKAGVAYESLKKYKEAQAVYETIKKDYSESIEGRDIDKYIARSQAFAQ